jgi:outer membrane protein
VKNRKLVILIVLAVVLVSVSISIYLNKKATPHYQYAYLDTNKVVQTYNQSAEFQQLYQKAEKELNEFGHSLQEQINKEVSDLEKEKEKQKQGKSAAKQRALDEEYGKKLQKLYEEKQVELDNKKAEIYAQLDQNLLMKIKEATAKIAKKRGLPLVVDERAIYYGGIDLTEQVLTVLKNGGVQENE